MHVANITFLLDSIDSEGHMISDINSAISILLFNFGDGLALLLCSHPGMGTDRMHPPKVLERAGSPSASLGPDYTAGSW